MEWLFGISVCCRWFGEMIHSFQNTKCVLWSYRWYILINSKGSDMHLIKAQPLISIGLVLPLPLMTQDPLSVQLVKIPDISLPGCAFVNNILFNIVCVYGRGQWKRHFGLFFPFPAYPTLRQGCSPKWPQGQRKFGQAVVKQMWNTKFD